MIIEHVHLMSREDGHRLVSNSELQTHRDCPRRWWLAWFRGLQPRGRDVTGARSTGTRVHAALAALYVPDGETPANPVDALEQVIHEDSAAFDDSNRDSPNYLLARGKLDSQFELERAMVSGYVQWLEETGADSQLEVVASETYVEADFHEFVENTTLIGKLDARVRNRMTGRRSFIDHKTVGSLEEPTLGLNQQMLHYHVIEWLNTAEGEERCDGALYNMLRKVKRSRAATPPFYARRPVDHNQHELESYRETLIGAVGNMRDAEMYLGLGYPHHQIVPARPTRDCVWKCDFFKICRSFDDGSRVEAAVEHLYEVQNPLTYYGAENPLAEN